MRVGVHEAGEQRRIREVKNLGVGWQLDADVAAGLADLVAAHDDPAVLQIALSFPQKP